MNAKEYLGQSYQLEQRINSKLEQVQRLNELATKVNSTISDMPGSSTRNVHKMEDVVVKIVDLQAEINSDIDGLVDLKRETMNAIRSIKDPEAQTVLELRYLCYKTWEEIAVALEFGIDNVYRIRKKALKDIKISKTIQ